MVLLVVSLQAVVRFMAHGRTHPAFKGVAASLCCVIVLEAAEALGKLTLPNKWLIVVKLVVLNQPIVYQAVRLL